MFRKIFASGSLRTEQEALRCSKEKLNELRTWGSKLIRHNSVP